MDVQELQKLNDKTTNFANIFNISNLTQIPPLSEDNFETKSSLSCLHTKKKSPIQDYLFAFDDSCNFQPKGYFS